MPNIYHILRWEAPQPPSPETLSRWLSREGFSPPEISTLETGQKTPEVRFAEPTAYLLISGDAQMALPGYGVVDLAPGDWLELAPGTVHDMLALGTQPAAFFRLPLSSFPAL